MAGPVLGAGADRWAADDSMNELETAMWRAERHPQRSSTMCSLLILDQTPDSVSYTHLDVYKRQIEGGRTRTGKLRPPVHGILRYLAAAVEAEPGPDVYVVPIAIVYDQLHEVAGMTAEARGSRKTPEDLTLSLIHI